MFINGKFLEPYYISKKESRFIELYEKLNDVSNEDKWDSTKKNNSLIHFAEKNNISYLVIEKDNDVHTNVHDKNMLKNQMMGYFLNQAQKESRTLDSTDVYQINQSWDPWNQSYYVDMWGSLDDGSQFLLRSPVESMRESASISNRFLLYIGSVLIVVSILLIWYFSKRITDPIRELARLSDRMADLDFDAKYTSGGSNEIGELGENFNRMSEKLESTISELKKANNSLQKDIEQKDKLEKMRNEFLGNVSHELKTPIALIQGYAEGLKDDMCDDKESRDFYTDVIIDESHKMNTMVKSVDDNLGNYRIPEAARALQEFVDDMSNWYVRRSRERFWAKDMPQDKINAYMTLYKALVTVSKAAAPMIPFMTEDIYQNIVRSVDETAPESIHLCDFPEVNESYIDKELEENMERVLDIVVLGRACRNASAIKNRQPIGKMFVKAEFELSDFYKEIIEEELNVKEVEFTDDVRAFTSYSFKPQLRTVGPKYGKFLGKIKEALSSLDGNAAMDKINAGEPLTFDFDGNEVVLEKEDLLIDMAQVEGYVSESDNNITVVLDTKLSDELIEEGFVREIISKIQTMRKEADFQVMDKIVVNVDKNDTIKAIIENNLDEIKSEVLADNVIFGKINGYEKEWNINGEKVTFGVEKAL